MTIAPEMPKWFQTGDIANWTATVVQLIGYGLTGRNIVPWNVFACFIGVLPQMAACRIWKDKVITVVHIGAFLSLLNGYMNA